MALETEIIGSEVVHLVGQGVAMVNGLPVPIGRQQITPAEIMERLKSVVCMPYDGPEPEYRDKNLLEVALIKTARKAAEGDMEAMEKLLNRIMGKPIQQVANLNMNASLADFLNGIVKTEEQAQVASDPFED